MRLNKLYRFLCFICVVVLLPGCVAGIVAGQAVNLTRMYSKDSVEVTLDQLDTIRIRSQLDGVNHLVILNDSDLARAFVESWKEAGKQASIVTGYKDPALLSQKQAARTMRSACKRKIDAVISSHIREDADTGSDMGLFVGQAPTIEADLFLYSCQTKKIESSPIKIVFNRPGQANDQAGSLIGTGLAAKLIEILDE